MKPIDIGALVDVGEPRLSPDGRTAAVVVTTVDLDANAYRSRIWLIDVVEGAPPRSLTGEGCRHVHPRWAPDGDRIAYLEVSDDEDELDRRSIVLVQPVGGGDAVEVLAWPDDVDELEWSPDGTLLALAARVRDEERYSQRRTKDQPPRRISTLFSRLDNVGWTSDRHRQLLVVPVDGSGAVRSLTSGPYEHQGVAWSPDGRRLAFTAARHDDWDLTRAVDVFVVGVEGGEPQRVTGTDLLYADPVWSPDGSQVAVHVSDERTTPRHGQIGIVDIASGALRVITERLDRQCTPFGVTGRMAWDGDGVWFAVEDAGNVHLYRAGSGEVEAVVSGERCVTGFDARAGRAVFTATSATTLPELFVIDGDTDRCVSPFGAHFAEQRRLQTPERFTAVSTGGAEVEGWVMRPVGFTTGRRYPTLVNIHGGPFTQYGNRFFDEFQLQAGAGFAVVYCNPRGSSGYSEAWGRAIRWPECKLDPGGGWGTVDYDDIMAVVEEAVRRFDFIDSERMGVLGGSYGGYMTSWIIGHTDRFKAACSERAVNDLLHLEHDSDIASTFEDYVGVSHLDDPEPYRRQSPITYVKAMTTPVLILHSENDLRCPISQADELFVALRLLRRDVEYVRFPGEGHELSRSGAPMHRVQRAEIILDWFTRRL